MCVVSQKGRTALILASNYLNTGITLLESKEAKKARESWEAWEAKTQVGGEVKPDGVGGRVGGGCEQVELAGVQMCGLGQGFMCNNCESPVIDATLDIASQCGDTSALCHLKVIKSLLASGADKEVRDEVGCEVWGREGIYLFGTVSVGS